MHDFDHLGSWRSLSEEKVNKLYTAANAELRQRCAIALGDENQREKLITVDNFADMVCVLCALLHEGSTGLSEAILDASEHLRSGEAGMAIGRYEEFLRSCSSQFYNEIAQAQIHAIEQGQACKD